MQSYAGVMPKRSERLRCSVWMTTVLAALVAVVIANPGQAGPCDPPSATVRAAPAEPAAGLFRPLVGVPADVDVWIRLVDGRSLTDAPEAAALASSLLDLLGSGARPQSDGAPSWPTLAERLGMKPLEAFATYLGKDVRFLSRGEDAAHEWVLLTKITDEDAARLITQLRAVVRGDGRFELPEDRLTLAYRTPWLVIGRAHADRLVREFSERASIDAAPALEATLAERFATTRPEQLADGQLAIAFRGSAAWSGTTAMTLSVRGAMLRGAMCGEYLNPPLPAAEQAALDDSILAWFDTPALAVMLDPIRPHVLPGDAIIVAALPEIVPSAAVRANFGKRRLVVLGEVEDATMRCPAIAVAYEVEDGDQAVDDQDRLVRMVLDRVRTRIAEPNGITMDPFTVPADRGAPRSAVIAPVLRQFAGEHPLLRKASLNWQTLNAPGGSWQIYATDPAWLQEVLSRLKSGTQGKPVGKREFAHAGRCRGDRLAGHVRSWSPESKAFSPPDGQGFSNGIELIATMAERFRTVEWCVSRPLPLRLEMSVSAQLAPPASAEKAP